MTELDPEHLTELTTPQLTRIQLYCAALYDIMDQNSELIETSQGAVKTWTGYVGATADSVGIPEGVRTRVIRRLADIGSIQVVETGRRNVRSIIALLTPPTGEAWESEADSGQSALTNAPDPAILAREVKSLIDQIGGVDVKAVLVNFEERIQKLEVQFRKLQDVSGED